MKRKWKGKEYNRKRRSRKGEEGEVTKHEKGNIGKRKRKLQNRKR